MNTPYAEVIGDPIAQSKSPIIHRHWLDQLKLAGEYRRTRVGREEIAHFLRGRRSDAGWRGCNVTIPHKEAVLDLVDALDAGAAAAVGAVNCVVPRSGELVGYNTDIQGIAAALAGTVVQGRKVAIIGAGGAARAALAFLAEQRVGEILIIARDPARAERLGEMVGPAEFRISDFACPARALTGASLIVNASPLGMVGCPAMPPDLIAAVARAPEATLFDMVYNPVATPFLGAGTGKRIDGLAMLVGQAAQAFELFFGAPAPAPDQGLRALLSET